MSLFSVGQSPRLKGFPNRKPLQLLPFYPSLVAPEWEWFYKGDEGTWPVWDGGGDTVRDLSGHNRHASITNGTWVATPSGLGLDLATGYINVGSASQFPMGATTGQPFTVGMRFTLDSHTQGVSQSFFGYFDGTRAFQCQVRVASNPDAYRLLYGPNPFDQPFGGLVTAGEHFIIFTFSTAGVGRFYVDRQLVATDPSPQGDFTPVSVDFIFGARGTASSGRDGHMDGKIDYCFFRSVEWSGEQVGLLFDSPYGPFRTRSLPLFPSSAADTLDVAQMLSPTPRWDSKVRFY